MIQIAKINKAKRMQNNKIKVKNLFKFLAKSKHKAGEGLEQGQYPFYTSSATVNKYFDEYDFESDKLIFATGGSASVHYAKSKFAVSTDNFVLEPFENVNAKYVYYYLKNNIRILQDGFHGAGLQHLSKDYLSEIGIPMLNSIEQQKIVSILDKADEIRTKKKQANEKLDEFLNSKFFEIFGNLETNTNGWKVEKLEDISYKITDGVHSKPVYTDSGIPFVSVKDITTKKLLLNDCKFISNEAHIKYSKRCKPEYEDVLYTKVGATYGRACVVDTQEEFSLYVSVALIKPKKNIINPYFLKAVLNTDSIKKQADKRIKGIGVPDLHLIEIKNFIIPVPPMVEQMKFLKIVEKVEEQKQRNEKIIEQMDNLFNSLSQKAFKGEL